MSVTGPMLMELGKREATKCGINNFKASEGWLDKVKIRAGLVAIKNVFHLIFFKNISGNSSISVLNQNLVHSNCLSTQVLSDNPVSLLHLIKPAF